MAMSVRYEVPTRAKKIMCPRHEDVQLDEWKYNKDLGTNETEKVGSSPIEDKMIKLG